MDHVTGTTRTVNLGHGPHVVFKRVPRPAILDFVLELVHPSNLGPLPPSPDFMVSKAIQIGLVADRQSAMVEVTVWQRSLNAEQDALLMARNRATYYCI